MTFVLSVLMFLKVISNAKAQEFIIDNGLGV